MNDMNEALGRELSWDDQIENEGSDFEPLPDGEYDFEIRRGGGWQVATRWQPATRQQLTASSKTQTETNTMFLMTLS